MGIGEASAWRLARAVAAVVVVGRDVTRGRTTEDCLKEYSPALILQGDMSRGLGEGGGGRGASHFARLDILVSSAGVEPRPLLMHEMPEAEFDRVIGINLKGTFLVIKQAVPWMLAGGGQAS